MRVRSEDRLTMAIPFMPVGRGGGVDQDSGINDRRLPVDPIAEDFLLFRSRGRCCGWHAHADRVDDRLPRDPVPLVVLHVGGEGGRRVVPPIADRTLEGFHVVVGLHVDLQVIGSGECGLTVGTSVPLIPRVQFDMAIPAALVLEQSLAVIAIERHLVRVDLLLRRVHLTDVV